MKSLAIIDAHHHLWDLSRVNYPWLGEADKTAFFGDYSALERNYLFSDYLADNQHQDVVKTVHLQADAAPSDALAETRWLTEVANRSGGLPHAIVAYADFSQPDVESVLEAHCAYDRVRGVRQILNFHESPRLSYTPSNYLEDETWRSNFPLLAKFGLSFDLQIYYQQMQRAAQLAAEHPDIQFILNHTGMPVERDVRGIEGWREGMMALAECPNVAVKISGLGMTDPRWTTKRIEPFVLETIAIFGVERCMFGSNFPVDGLFSSYDALFDAYRAIVSDFSAPEQSMLFQNNAERFYRI